jgi:chaperonin GroEL
VIREDMGFTLEKASMDVLGSATKVVITRDSTLVVTDGSTREAVEKRVSQLKNLIEVRRELSDLNIITSSLDYFISNIFCRILKKISKRI